MIAAGNLFAGMPANLAEEEFRLLASSPDAKIERIVSTGQSSPPGFWFDQDWTEWVFLLAGSAGLRLAEEERARLLKPGDYLEIPAHTRHRVEWTDADKPTVWLAVHLKNGSA